MSQGGQLFFLNETKGWSAMTEEEKAFKEGVDQWIDEQIRYAFGSLTHPFENRIARLQQRIREVKTRIQRVSNQIEQQSPNKKSTHI